MPTNKVKRLLILCPYPTGTAASQRFRFEHYLPWLQEQGIDITIKSFISTNTWAILYKPGHTLKKALGILSGFVRRIGVLFSVGKYQVIFIHREASPVGPPFVEWILAKILRKKIVYDFDDAIWLANTSEANKFASRFKWHQKVASICRWSSAVTTGNDYLARYAGQYNENVIVIPTVVDTDFNHNRLQNHNTDHPNIGWTGTHSTGTYLADIKPVLDKLNKQDPFRFVVISDAPPSVQIDNLDFVPWNQAQEIEDLLRFHIGLMPLTDDEWSRGKCGFKAIQYMALGIPALVSPVEANVKIVDNGVNGFVCGTDQEWMDAMRKLLTDHNLRVKMGESAREKIVNSYSVKATRELFLKAISV